MHYVSSPEEAKPLSYLKSSHYAVLTAKSKNSLVEKVEQFFLTFPRNMFKLFIIISNTAPSEAELVVYDRKESASRISSSTYEPRKVSFDLNSDLRRVIFAETLIPDLIQNGVIFNKKIFLVKLSI